LVRRARNCAPGDSVVGVDGVPAGIGTGETGGSSSAANPAQVERAPS